MPNYRTIPLTSLSDIELLELNQLLKLSLSLEDMQAIQVIYLEEKREPTDVEMELIAQTWSEHCKHRIFSATIQHSSNGKLEEINSLFKTYIKEPSERIMKKKPSFVLSAFHDNAGFIRLDDQQAVCLKVETHNHPSAIEPYAGANTGLGGVIRDILGAGKGAKPIASLDVFCFGFPNTPANKIKSVDTIHPLGVFRGVVRGVRDYGNRMGIPTVLGAIQFDNQYLYNPLVFCGTAGVIDQRHVNKQMYAGLKLLVVGGLTGKDGLKGATFSSVALDADSHEEDSQAVQIGNPVEEKKVLDFILQAREAGLIVSITDCGAGGIASATGEMLSETGGKIFLERLPLKEEGMTSWEIFLSESQERMVLAVEEKDLTKLAQLASCYQTNLAEIGYSDNTGILKVWHHDNLVCQLDNSRLHEAPIRQLTSNFNSPSTQAIDYELVSWGKELENLLGDWSIVSREPVIREYDFEVQGNTLLKPLAGASGDAPQDGSVIDIPSSQKAVAMAVSILPEWGKVDPYAMGQASIDEVVRQLVAMGADPDQIALLDNFCLGNPNDPDELGGLVECVKGISIAIEQFEAPFISGKDSFYNYFELDGEEINIPLSFLASGMGVLPNKKKLVGSSLRKTDSSIYLLGWTEDQLGGSIYAKQNKLKNLVVPYTNVTENLDHYRRYHQAVEKNLILAAHDISEGGLSVALAEFGFSDLAGLEVDLTKVSSRKGFVSPVVPLFSESTGRLLIEVASANEKAFEGLFKGSPLVKLGQSTDEHRQLKIVYKERVLIEEELEGLKLIWKTKLEDYY